MCMLTCILRWHYFATSPLKSKYVISILLIFFMKLNDVDINTSDTSTPTHNQILGPITRARVRQLNNRVSSFLASYSFYLDNGNMWSVLLLRNDGQERNGVVFAPVAFRFYNISSLWRPPDSVWTWIQACKYFLESSWSLLSYASNVKSISYRSRPQSLFWCRDIFLSMVLRHLILVHWTVYVESNSDAS
jgi:hypothetical protein